MIRRIRFATAVISLCTLTATGGATASSLFASPAHDAEPTFTTSVPITPIASASPSIDESALATLKRVETAMFALKSYRAEC